LLTLGPALIAMSWMDRVHFAVTNPLIVFGRVPFFYYAAHLVLAHTIAIALNFARYDGTPFLGIAFPSMGGPSDSFPSNYGFPLGVVYAVWIVVLLILYPACLWIARVKHRRQDWWLSYL
jgi:hypothetical protein